MAGLKKPAAEAKQRRLTLKQKNEVLQLSGEKVNRPDLLCNSNIMVDHGLQISQRSIASKLGVSQAAVSQIIKKKTSVLEAMNSKIESRKVYRLKIEPYCHGVLIFGLIGIFDLFLLNSLGGGGGRIYFLV